MMTLPRKFLCFAVFLFVFPTWAQDRFPPLIKKGEPITLEAYEYYQENPYNTYIIDPAAIPEVVTHPDGRMDVVLSDELTVTLGQKLTLIPDMEIPGRINEITCLPLNLRTRCTAYADMMLKHYRVIWKNHPDPAKIGTNVRVRLPARKA